MFKVGQQVQQFYKNIPLYNLNPVYIKSVGPKWITSTDNIRMSSVGKNSHFSFKVV